MQNLIVDMFEKSTNHAGMTRVEFLEAVEAFLRETGMPDRALGLAAVNETSFVKKLRDGREARERTRERVLAFMDQHRQNCEAGETSTKAATPPPSGNEAAA